MARLACALLLLAVAICSAAENRIVGGNTASIEKYPSLVQVQSMVFPHVWTQSCGGSILTSRCFLSAARCFRGAGFTERFRRIIAGSSVRNTGGITVNVDIVHIHPSFRENIGYDGDIAVVRLQTPLTFSNLIQRVAIPSQGSPTPDNLPVIQAGWGVTLEELPDIRAEELQEVTVLTVNNAQCTRNYADFIIPRTVTPNMICAGRPEGGAGACLGDTGGPLYFNNIVIGIVSWGWGCTNATFPRVHTAVSSYTDWIVNTAV